MAITAEKNTSKDQSGKDSKQFEGSWGIPGMDIVLNVRAHFENPDDPRNHAHPGGSPGRYKVSFVFSKPDRAPIKENQIMVDGSAIPGNSHLRLGDSDEYRVTLSVFLEGIDYVFQGFAGSDGSLGKMEIELDADYAKDAWLKAHNALGPLLSRLSLALDIPLNIFNVTVYEISAHAFMSTATLPYISRMGTTSIGAPMENELLKYASLYREALNSNSSNYQFLCFYKIIEGLRGRRERRVTEENKKAIEAGQTPKRPRDVIPTDPGGLSTWLNAIFGPQRWSELALDQIFPEVTLGRKVNDLISSNKELDMIRNRIAHTIVRDPNMETLSIDNAIHIAEVRTWLPFCKCLAIYLLRKEFPDQI